MVQKIKLYFQNNRNRFRIIRYTLISFVLLIITWLLDYKYPYLKSDLPDILLLSPEVTSTFLANLTGTFLTVSTFSLTTTLTVLNKYAGSFTPRVVQDFIDKPNVLSLFGVFVGGFFYTVLSLFLIQNIESNTPLVTGTLAVFYAIAAMVAFILFVIRVLKDIKLSSVMDSVYDNSNKLIEELSEKQKLSKRYEKEGCLKEYEIYSNESGYLYSIDKAGLLKALKDIKCELIVLKRINDFVLEGTLIARLKVFEDVDLDEDWDKLYEKLNTNLVLNNSKNDKKDYHHEITNLVEIALRALSPAVNDPNTAIECARKIGLLLGKLMSTDKNYVVLGENESSKIIYNGYSVNEELYLSFNQILHYGKEDPLVSQAVLNSIYTIYLMSGHSAEDEIEKFFHYCYELCYEVMKTEKDKEALSKIHMDFNNRKKEKLHMDEAE